MMHGTPAQDGQGLGSYTFGELLDAVAARTPTPGGGAVASAVGALAAALARMVVAYSLGKKSLAEHQSALDRAGAALDRGRALLLELAEEDAAAFERVGELIKLPPSDPRREREMPEAVRLAVQPPRASAAACADLLRLMETLVGATNRQLRSDLAAAAVLAEAGARASWWNVAINLPLLADPAERERIEAEVRGFADDAAARRARIEREAMGETPAGMP